ncbi:hypothetical protein TWF694_009748 [Orbilia ellipsospora]|uniref:Uncharacterized protein n=1 Tax=Orbilia ellipsospora TaxID=2528407 RepID=A0AAV9XD40_9PEZI
MPDFHVDGVRTYLTSYSLPARTEFDEINYWDRNPREAPPYALHEEIRTEMHEFMPEGLLLPRYDNHLVPVKYCKVAAQPGEPLQVHFMVWSQQVMHDMDLPGKEDEFLDLRVELFVNGRIIDVAYVDHAQIKPNGIPVGIEFTGERAGDAKEYPMFFTMPSFPPTKNMEEANLNILVTLGRIGGYRFYDESKRMSKMIRMKAVHGKYESSTTDKEFNAYVWRKEHQNLIRDRDLNPKSKFWNWKKLWTKNDLYRLTLLHQAFDSCQRAWEELEREAELEKEAREEKEDAEGVITVMVRPESPPKQDKGPKSTSTPGTTMSALSPASASTQHSPPANSDTAESPYSFRRARRVESSNNSVGTPQSVQPEPSKTMRQVSATKKQKLSPVLAKNKVTTPSQSVTKAQSPQSSGTKNKAAFTMLSVQKGDPQQASSTNVTFGSTKYKTIRQYYRDFTPYKDLCRMNYQIVNPKTRELRSGMRLSL